MQEPLWVFVSPASSLGEGGESKRLAFVAVVRRVAGRGEAVSRLQAPFKASFWRLLVSR